MSLEDALRRAERLRSLGHTFYRRPRRFAPVHCELNSHYSQLVVVNPAAGRAGNLIQYNGGEEGEEYELEWFDDNRQLGHFGTVREAVKENPNRAPDETTLQHLLDASPLPAEWLWGEIRGDVLIRLVVLHTRPANYPPSCSSLAIKGVGSLDLRYDSKWIDPAKLWRAIRRGQLVPMRERLRTAGVSVHFGLSPTSALMKVGDKLFGLNELDKAWRYRQADITWKDITDSL